MRRHAACLLLLLAAAGCATSPPIPTQPETQAAAAERRAKASRPAYNLAGYPPAVREGYIDGCESAKQSDYARKDAKRSRATRSTRSGWNDGFSICGKK